MADYIKRDKSLLIWLSNSAYEQVQKVPAADVVPWEWLERYAHGQRMNFASDFVAEARKWYEEGLHWAIRSDEDGGGVNDADN